MNNEVDRGKLKLAIKRILRLFGWNLVRDSQIRELWSSKDRLILATNQLERLRIFQDSALGSEMSLNYLSNFGDIKSQLLQEVFVLSALEQRKSGYFIEAGASDGIDCSNTYLLEKGFGWSGLLIEPSESAFRRLVSNRSSHVFNAALWSESNLNLHFTETNSPGLSTITSLKESDFLSQDRTVLKEYEVPTITLQDLLSKYNAPNEIDYLSLDTEGSEFEILKNFDFSQYKFNIISVEHAWNERSRNSVITLLKVHGYAQIRAELTEYESWFVGPKVLENLINRNLMSLIQSD